MHLHRTEHGLTLIELVTVVAIISILAAVAWSMYENEAASNRRKDAVMALIAAEQAMANFKAENGSYTGATLASYKPTVANTPLQNCQFRGYRIDNSESCRGLYLITVRVLAGSYTLTASPIAGRAQNNANFVDPCGSFTLNNLGVKGITGAAPWNVSKCWAL